jgi:hypothetical protein
VYSAARFYQRATPSSIAWQVSQFGTVWVVYGRKKWYFPYKNRVKNGKKQSFFGQKLAKKCCFWG